MNEMTWKEYVRKAEERKAAWAEHNADSVQPEPQEINLDEAKLEMAELRDELHFYQSETVRVINEMHALQDAITEQEKKTAPVRKIASSKASGRNRKTPPKTQKDLLAGLAKELKDHPELAAKLAAAMK